MIHTGKGQQRCAGGGTRYDTLIGPNHMLESVGYSIAHHLFPWAPIKDGIGEVLSGSISTLATAQDAVDELSIIGRSHQSHRRRATGQESLYVRFTIQGWRLSIQATKISVASSLPLNRGHPRDRTEFRLEPGRVIRKGA